MKSKLTEKSSAPWIVGAVALAGAGAFAAWANFRSPEVAVVASAAAPQAQQAAAAAAVAEPPAGAQAGVAPEAVEVDGAPVASGPPYPQPAGAVPAGKVWSAEHGHWHDAGPAASAPGAPVANVTFPSQNKRPISTPDGRVWSEEHQHWHDATANGGISDVRVFAPPPKAGSLPGAPPPGPAPEGKVWSSEHGHWHDLKTAGGAEAPKPAASESTPPPQQ